MPDSEPEGAERLLFLIERAPIVGIGQIHMEGPDGSRGRAGARYPVTIVEANTPATGAPGISGSGRAGETLRATTDAIADIDGVAGAAYRYRWIRVDGAHETRIGADSALYGPVAADIGKRVRVEVRFTDDLGFAEGPLASREVAIHAAMPPRVCPAPGSPGPGRVRLWEGAVGVGAVQVFKVPIAYGYYEGDPVLSPGGTLSPGEVSIGGEAYAVEGVYASTAGQLVFNLDGALSAMERAGLVLHVCGETYAFADAAHDPATDAYSWRNAGLDWSGVAERTVSLSTTRSPATGMPGIEGTGRIGETLTATTDDIADPDGLTGVEFSYQWVRIDAGTGTDIAGATGETYTVTAEDVFKAVRVRVGFTDDRSIAEEVTSAAFSIGNTPATGVPELRGSARVGRSMQAHTGGIVDPDGLTNAAFSYRWVRIDGTTETEVATGSRNYRAVAADEGTRIRVEVTFTDDLGTAEGPFASTPATVLDASPPPSTNSQCTAPDLAGRVVIWNQRISLFAGGNRIGTGSLVGQGSVPSPNFRIGTAAAYTIDGAAADSGGSSNGRIEFSLNRALAASHAEALVLHDCDEPFAFADAVYAESGHTYRWPAAGANWQGTSFARTLRLSVPGNSAATGAPVVTGTARVGATLSALTHAIADVDGRAGASFTYQWVRVDGATETDIAGATASTYELVAADAGKQVKVKVSFTDDSGNEEELTGPAFPRSATIAAAPVPMEPGDLLSATLTAKSFFTADVGCGSGDGTTGCANTDVLTDNDFDIGTTTHTITQLTVDGGTITLRLNIGLSDADEGTHSLEVTEGATTSTLKFSDGTTSVPNEYEWSGTGQSWSAGDSVTVKVVSVPPDTTPPEVNEALANRVGRTGTVFVLGFSEYIDQVNRAPASALVVTADGSPVTVAEVVQDFGKDSHFPYLLSHPPGPGGYGHLHRPDLRRRRQRDPGRSRQRRGELHRIGPQRLHRHRRPGQAGGT